MLRPRFSAVLFLMLLAEAAACGAGHAAPIQNPEDVVLPDPDLTKAARFPAGAATAGEARIGPALDKAEVRAGDCSPLSPCAVTGPVPSDAAMAAPPQPSQGERRRIRQPG